MTTEEKIKIMQAYLDGKIIETRKHNDKYDKIEWHETENPEWIWGIYDYRVKQEETYRPYKSIEEMLDDIKVRLDENYGGMQHPVFSGMWLKQKDYDMMTQITGTLNDSSLDHQEILLGQIWIRLEKAFYDYTFLDGTPFGIKVE